jgi:hypothetical protein
MVPAVSRGRFDGRADILNHNVRRCPVFTNACALANFAQSVELWGG